MKLTRVMSLMILLVLCCSISYVRANDRMFPLRASSNDSVLVDVDYIKLANAKMIERNYLIKINLTKDTIIRNKDVLLDVYKDNLLYKEKVINNLKDSNKKYKNRFNIMKYSTIGIISILSIVLMIK